MSDQSKKTLTQADVVFLLKSFEKVLVTKDDLENMRHEFSHLPTKDEFYQSQDELVTRLKKIDENTDVQAGQIDDHESRLNRIESHLNLGIA